MAKEPRTASALEAMINTLLATDGAFVSVQQDEELGWRALVIITPKDSPHIQERADLIVDDLRRRYKLIG
jgi:hypothetical protein